MKALILGGTAFAGKRIVEKLLERGDTVSVFTRGNIIPDFQAGVEFITGDRRDYDNFYSLLHKCKYDIVIDNSKLTLEQAMIKPVKMVKDFLRKKKK